METKNIETNHITVLISDFILEKGGSWETSVLLMRLQDIRNNVSSIQQTIEHIDRTLMRIDDKAHDYEYDDNQNMADYYIALYDLHVIAMGELERIAE